VILVIKPDCLYTATVSFFLNPAAHQCILH
jgi:hypothetical protein